MSQVVRLVVTAMIVAATFRLAAARRSVRPTSLHTSWLWAVATLGSWTAVLLAELLRLLPTEATDVWWFLTAVLAVCPPVAVLGARRPGVWAWTWFVLLPLVLVLGLPAWTTIYQMAARGAVDERIAIEPAVAIGFVLVIAMGAGNYVSTWHTSAALLYAVSLVLVGGPLVHGFEEVFPAQPTTRMAATVCLAVAVMLPGRLRGRSRSAPPLERLCLAFRDWFGIVWSRRVFDRVNEALAARRLPLRLGLGGLMWLKPPHEIEPPVAEESLDHAEQTLRWLLKRFVEPQWIDRRMEAQD